jgi:tRNA U38,U39,U40 pseudouridine synthase TruA
MACNLVGILIDEAKRKIDIEEISDILKSRKSPAAGICAPDHGLILHQVHYTHSN